MRYKYWLASTPLSVIPEKYKLFLNAGSAEEIYNMTETELRLIYNWRGDSLERFLSRRNEMDTEKEYDSFKASGMSLVTIEDKEYPDRLRWIANPPYALFYIGDLSILNTRTIGIVGARRCSEYGKSCAFNLAKQLALRKNTIISGMATGIDSHAHLGSIEGSGKTAAILGCGADVVYPRNNKALYERIKKDGLVISEFSPGCAPLPINFPIRNRIVSGLSDILVVVEAKKRSGSLITADFALEQGKDVYTVPGRICDPLSEGCNRLISQGADVLTDIEEFAEQHQVEKPKKQIPKKSFTLNDHEAIIYDLIELQPVELERILCLSPLSATESIEAVISLLNNGYIKEIFKNCYIRETLT